MARNLNSEAKEKEKQNKLRKHKITAFKQCKHNTLGRQLTLSQYLTLISFFLSKQNKHQDTIIYEVFSSIPKVALQSIAKSKNIMAL